MIPFWFVLSLIFSFLSFSSYATELYSDEIYVGFGSGFYSVDKSNSTGETSDNLLNYTELTLSYSQGTAFSYEGRIGVNDESLLFSLSAKYKYRLNDRSSLIFGAGVGTFNSEYFPTLSLGIKKEINDYYTFYLNNELQSFSNVRNYLIGAGIKFNIFPNRKKSELVVDNVQEGFSELVTEDANLIEKKDKDVIRAQSGKCKNIYYVKKGDHIWAIARKYNLSPKQLIRINDDKIENPNLIIPGLDICLEFYDGV